MSLDPIYASFDADEQTFLRYGDLARAGKRASARQAGLPIRMALASDETFPREGKMNFLDNQIDPTTGTIRARAVFRNADLSLTPGLFVRAAPAGHRALSRPADPGPRRRHRSRQAVRLRRDARRATIEYRGVTLGPIVDGLRVVRSGLEAGDLVVVNGLQRVRPGVKVDVTAVAMDAPPSRMGPQS